MKFFTNKSIWSKIVIILIFVLLFEFAVTKPTLASVGAEVGENVIEFGGKLMNPLMSVVVSLADGMMEIAQSSIMGTDESVVPVDVDQSIWEKIGKFFVVAVTVIAAIAVVVAAVTTGGGIFAVIGAIAGGLFKVRRSRYYWILCGKHGRKSN